MKRRSAFTPAGHLGTKRMGELAELGFMYRAAAYGIGVAKPYGDSFPYDFLTQHGKRVLRVQVKSCFSAERRRYAGFPIIVACHWGQGKMNYSVDDVDFIAAGTCPERSRRIAKYDTWYLIPMESLGTRKNIRVYPGKQRPRSGGQYEQYREVWNLLLDEVYVEKQRYTSRQLCRMASVESAQQENTLVKSKAARSLLSTCEKRGGAPSNRLQRRTGSHGAGLCSSGSQDFEARYRSVGCRSLPSW